MFKKIICSLLVFTCLFNTSLTSKIVFAQENESESENTVQETVTEDYSTYRQTKTIIQENASQDLIQRLAYCDNNEKDLEKEISDTLLETFKLKEAKERIDSASKNANKTIEKLKTEKKKESEVGKILYENITTNLNDEYLLAVIIFCEAGNQTYEGKVAVGNVVLNRVASPKFANTIETVIRQKGQFEPVWTGWYDKELAKNKVNDSCMQAAKDALNGVNIVGDSLFFHRTKGNDPGIILGDHVFY